MSKRFVAREDVIRDPLISEYLPVIRGHVFNKYRWIEERGNCLMTIDDLIQVASITLIRLVGKWDEYLANEGKSRDGNEKLFWYYLERDVKHAVHNYYKREGEDGGGDLSLTGEEDSDDWLEHRTSLRAPMQSPGMRVTVRDIVDYFSMMPPRDKVMIALRYFDEIPVKQIADIIETSEKTTRNLTLRAVARWRVIARNQFVDYPEEEPTRVAVAWEPPEPLLDYLRDRHRKDLAEYLGVVTISFRADPGYLVEILGTKQKVTPGVHEITLSPAQQQWADEMLQEGVSMREVSRSLEVSYAAVRGHAARRYAAY